MSDYNSTRLDELAEALKAGGGPSSSPELIVAELTNTTDLGFVARARAVVTAAGPFSKYGGEWLVRACAAQGVHYADVSDEFYWQREMIDRYDLAAKMSGAKLVLSAGFCALAGDLGSELVLDKLGPPTSTAAVDAWLEGYSGGLSAGVIAGEIAGRNASYPKPWGTDPYVLAPNASGGLRLDTAVQGMSYPATVKGEGVVIANLFGPYDARLLRRSFTHHNRAVRLRVGATPGMYARWSAFVAGHPRGWSSLAKCPNSEVLVDGRWSYRFRAAAGNSTAGAAAAEVLLAGAGDPGYNFTSASLAEVGLCLAGVTPGCLRPAPSTAGARSPAGVITPMVALEPTAVLRRYQQVGLLTAS